MYTDDRNAYRTTFIQAWDKYCKKLPLHDLEQKLVTVILSHPELQKFLSPKFQNQEFIAEENPFIHLSLHIALHEQLAADQPPGIKAVYEKLKSHIDLHHVEHIMIRCLMKALEEAQQTNHFDPQKYLQALQSLKI